LSEKCEFEYPSFFMCNCFVVSLLAMARGASRWVTPMKVIDMTVFLIELGIPSHRM
jgi:hypothetical protein